MSHSQSPDKGSETPTTEFLSPILTQAAVVLGSKGFFLVAGMASSLFLARILGAESLGRYQLGLVTVQILSVLAVLGCDKALTRYVPLLELGAPGRIRGLLRLNFGLSLAMSLFLAALLLGVAPFLSNQYFQASQMASVLRGFAFFLPVLSLFRVAAGAVNGARRSDLQATVRNVLVPSTFLLALSVVWLSGGGLAQAIGARTGAQLAGVILLVLYLQRRFSETYSEPEAEQASGTFDFSLKQYFSFSAPMLLTGLIHLLLGQMDIIMLGFFVSASEVGVYSIAVRLATLVIIGLEVLLPIIGPHFSDLSHRADFKKVEHLFKITTKWAAYSGMLLFVLLVTLQEEVLTFYGEEFAQGRTVLLFLLAAQLFRVVTGPTGQLLAMSGRPHWETVNTGGLVVLNFLLNLWLIPSFGPLGAALATVISSVLLSSLKLIEVYFLFALTPYRREHLKGVAASLLAGLVGYGTRLLMLPMEVDPLFLLSATGIAIIVTFTLGMLLMGLSEEDRIIGSLILRSFRSLR